MVQRFRLWVTSWRQRGSVGVGAAADAADDRNRVLGLNPSRIPNGKQWRFFPSFLSATERRWIQFFVTTGIIAIVALVVILSSKHLQSEPQAGGTVTIGMVGTPQFINPVLARDNTVDADLTQLLFRGVARMTADFQAIPDLADSITVSDDRKTYTVKLKSGLTWSDDEPITADDLKFTIDTIKDAQFGSPIRALFQDATVTVINETTATIVLTKPLAGFMTYLDTGLLPSHAWSDATPQTMNLAELNVKPISNGPYKFYSVTKDANGSIKAMTFIRNKAYAGTAPFINKLVIKFYSDQTTALDALTHESIDVLDRITPTEDSTLAKKFVRSSNPISQLTAVFMNQSQNPALKAAEVRQALTMTVDRQAMIKAVLPGHADPLTGPVLPGYPGENSATNVLRYDPTGAMKLLDDTGWKTGTNGIRQKGAQQLAFSLTVPDEPTYVAAANQLITSWKSLGVGVELKKIDPTTIQRDVIRPRSYEVLMFGQIIDADGDLYPFWDSSQQRDPGYNLSLYYNKQVDHDLEDARTTGSLDQHNTDYIDFQKLVAQDIPAIFLFQLRDVQAHRTILRGLSSNRIVNASNVFTGIGSWYVKTHLVWK